MVTKEKNAEDFFSTVHEAHMEKFTSELTLLAEWFRKDYPEATLRLEPDWNVPQRAMILTTTALTGKEATPENQGLGKSVMRIKWDHWNDPLWFGNIMANFQERMRKTITDFMNSHYRKEKLIHG